MDESTFDDFKSEIIKNNLKICDFKLDDIDITDWEPDQIVAIKGSLHVTYKPTGKQRSYATGNFTKPAVDFADDLISKYFLAT